MIIKDKTIEKGEDKRKNKKKHALSTGIFLIGLAMLFYYDAFWPWILALIGLIIIVEAFLTRQAKI